MIKSWWAEKSTSEKQIIAALAVLSLGAERSPHNFPKA